MSKKSEFAAAKYLAKVNPKKYRLSGSWDSNIKYNKTGLPYWCKFYKFELYETGNYYPTYVYRLTEMKE